MDGKKHKRPENSHVLIPVFLTNDDLRDRISKNLGENHVQHI